MRTAMLLLLSTFAATALGREPPGRNRIYEAGLSVFQTGSMELQGLGGSAIDIARTSRLSIWGGYRFGPHFSLLGDASYARPSYGATAVAETGDTTMVQADMDFATVHVKGVYHILDRPLTPFVELGAGWVYLDSNVPASSPTTGCGIDPWWGFVCAGFGRSYAKAKPSYEAGVGLRWDVSSRMLLRAGYERMHFETSDAATDAVTDIIRIATAWKW